jgi:hypothetical protein
MKTAPEGAVFFCAVTVKCWFAHVVPAQAGTQVCVSIRIRFPGLQPKLGSRLRGNDELTM